jgi:capsular polysaccharide biosynthesis protein
MPRWKRSDKLTEETALGRGSMYSPQLILQTLRQRMWTIMLVALVTTGAAIGFSLLQTPTYESSVLILVGQKTTGDTNSGPDVADLQELTLTVAKAVPTTPVAEAVVERLEAPPEGGAGEVLANSSAEPDPGTVFVNVSYKDSDPKRAQLIANTIGIVLSKKIPEMTLGANSITATVWEPATLPETPVSPNPVRNGLLTLVIGLVLCAGTVVALPGVGARVAGTLGERPSCQGIGQAGVLSRRHSDYSIVERVKEKKLLRALGRRGKLTAVGAALATSLSVEESRRILEELAFAGHLEVTFEDGKLLYSFWERD